MEFKAELRHDIIPFPIFTIILYSLLFLPYLCLLTDLLRSLSYQGSDHVVLRQTGADPPITPMEWRV